MFIKTPEQGFHFGTTEIKHLEKLYDARYIGYWTILDDHNDGWTENPVDIFYVANPSDSSNGYQYLGLYKDSGGKIIPVDASSAFSKAIVGILCRDGEVLVSRYRSHVVSKYNQSIDGGRDFIHTDGKTKVQIFILNGEFAFKEMKND